jgi:large subunit ribosomal protein L22
MEARAIHKYIPTSPRKMRLVIDLIRGRNVEEAISILHFSPKNSAREAEKTLRSAIANLQNKEDAGRIDFSQIYVKEAFVNGGPTMKRIRPAPMGRAYRVRKRSNHLTIVVAIREDVLREQRAKEAKKKAQAQTKKQPKKKETTTKEKES